MLVGLALAWPFVLLRGAIGVAFGVIVLAWPGLMPQDAALLFGAYAFSDGVLAILVALGVRDLAGFGSLMAEALIRTAIGLAVLAAPASSAQRFPDVMTAWIFLSGIGVLLIAVVLRRELAGEWPLPFAGITSLILGVVLRLVPQPEAATLWVLGPYTVLFGFMMLALALRLRQLSYEMSS